MFWMTSTTKLLYHKAKKSHSLRAPRSSSSENKPVEKMDPSKLGRVKQNPQRWQTIRSKETGKSMGEPLGQPFWSKVQNSEELCSLLLPAKIFFKCRNKLLKGSSHRGHPSYHPIWNTGENRDFSSWNFVWNMLKMTVRYHFGLTCEASLVLSMHQNSC